METTSYHRNLKSLEFRAKWSRGILLVYVALGIVGMAAQGLVFFTDFADPSNPVFTMILGGLTLINLLTFIASIIIIATWVYRAHANLRESRLDGLNYSPGWAAGSFFVPIIGLLLLGSAFFLFRIIGAITMAQSSGTGATQTFE